MHTRTHHVEDRLHRSYPSSTHNVCAGLTLVELLVTMAIFGMLTIVLTASFINLADTGTQTSAAQQAQDEVRALYDGLERELIYGEGYDYVVTSPTTGTPSNDCVDGVCPGMSMTVGARSDMDQYDVEYRRNGTRLEKATAKPGSMCESGITDACFLPVTSDNIVLNFVNFGWEFPGVVYSTEIRPITTVTLSGSVRTDDGATSVPIHQSSSFSPKEPLPLNAYVESESVPPNLTVTNADNCIHTVDQPWGNLNRDRYEVTTNSSGCDEIRISIEAYDQHTYLAVVKWKNDTLVQIGANVLYPSGEESVIGQGTDGSHLSRTITVPMRKGSVNTVTIEVYDKEANVRDVDVVIDNQGVWTPANPYDPDMRLTCRPDGGGGFYLRASLGFGSSLAGVDSSKFKPRNALEEHIRVYGCTGWNCTPPVGAGTACVNRFDFTWVQTLYSGEGGWVSVDSCPSGTLMLYKRTIYLDRLNGSSVTTGIFYRFRVTVVDPANPTVESTVVKPFRAYYGNEFWGQSTNMCHLESPGPGGKATHVCSTVCNSDDFSSSGSTSSGSTSSGSTSSGSTSSGSTSSGDPEPTSWGTSFGGALNVKVTGGSGSVTSNAKYLTVTGGPATVTIGAASWHATLAGKSALIATPAAVVAPGSSSVKVQIPNNTPLGTYWVRIRVSAGGEESIVTTPIVVEDAGGGEDS